MEKKEINELQELRDRIALSKPSDAKLYFVTRILREGMQRRKAIADKFLYKVYQIDIDDEIRSYLYTSTICQLDKTLKKDIYLFDYDPISDDTESLFTYSISHITPEAFQFLEIPRVEEFIIPEIGRQLFLHTLFYK